MFNGCSSLTAAPELPATTLPNNTYRQMFQGCKSLTAAPELPATTLANSCYESMFQGCTSLTAAPELPATTLANNSYRQMFRDCTSLTAAPELLPATTLVGSCYYGMFYGCTSLNYVKTAMTTQQLSSTTHTGNWLNNVASTGTYESTDPDFDETQITRGNSTVPEGWNIVKPAPAYTGLKLTAEQANSSVTLNKNNNPAILNLECSMDEGSTWQTFNVGTTYTLANVGDSICIRAPEGSPNTQGMAQGSSVYHYFAMTGKIAASGNIMSLYDKDCTTAMTTYAFYRLFQNCSSLTTAPELPATTLKDNCYYYMFSGCSSLTTAPELPATTLAQYCYQGMFFNCTSLTTAPELPATTLASSCYRSMFQSCTSLTTAPELPATTIPFDAYRQTFTSCSSLNYVKTAAPVSFINEKSIHLSWLNGVASTGTYVSTDPDFDESLITTRTGDTLPAGWTVEVAS